MRPMAMATTRTSITPARHAARAQHSARDAAREKLGPRLLRYGVTSTATSRATPATPCVSPIRKPGSTSWGGIPGLRRDRLGQPRRDGLLPTGRRAPALLPGNQSGLWQPGEQRFFRTTTSSPNTASLQGVARLSGGINLGTLGQVRAGWEENWWNAKLDVGSPFLPDLSKRYGGWIAQADLDSTDRLYFPTTRLVLKGHLFRLGGRRLQQTRRHCAGVYTSMGDWVLNSRVSYQGSPVGQLPIYDSGSLGGVFNMTAFAPGQLKGTT
jgi:hypothetical protein